MTSITICSCRSFLGRISGSAFSQALFSIILTGTPIRSDGEKSIWLAYNDKGAIQHPDAGTYTLTYVKAVDLGYCRPVTFHRHEGNFTVTLNGDGENISINGDNKSELPSSMAAIPGLSNALDFYKLYLYLNLEEDGITPLLAGYQSTMLQWGSRNWMS